MPEDDDSARPDRRRVLRGAVWLPPVVALAGAAPAFAASVGPLVVTADKIGLGLTLRLTFTGGTAGMTVSISSVSYTLVVVPITVAMSPTAGISSTGGTSTGPLGSLPVVTTTYTVVYTFGGATFTATAVA